MTRRTRALVWVRVCRCVCTGGDQRGYVAQMSTFGGHVHKEASDQLQKKTAGGGGYADEIEKSLEKAVAGMNIRHDDDNYSSDDEKYLVPGYKPDPEEEPHDKKPDDDVFYLFLHKQNLGAKLHIYL